MEKSKLKKKIVKFYSSYHLKRERTLPEWTKYYWDFFQGKVLEVGCGKMLPPEKIKNNYLGVDIVFEAIRFVKEKNYSGIVGDAENLPLKDNYFDTVCCHDLIEHTVDTPKVLKELIRVCKNKIIVFGPNYIENKVAFSFLDKVKSILKIALGKHKKIINLKNPHLEFDNNWDKDKDATTAINVFFLEKFFKEQNFQIKLSKTYLKKNLLNYIPLIKYTGSFMFFMAERNNQ